MRVLLILCLCEALFSSGIFGHFTKDKHHHAKDHHDDDDADDVKASSLSINMSPLQKITPSNIKFAYRLYTHLATKYPNDNIFFSPISISMAFSMLYYGAKGQTRTEIYDVLGFNTSSVSDQDIRKGFHEFIVTILYASNPDVELSTANALFVQEGRKLLEGFLKVLQVYYLSEAFPTNFQNSEQAVSRINGYVAKNTKGLIKNLFDSLETSTLLVLVNAIYFKGIWKKSFAAVEGLSDFHVDDNTVIKVSMMKSRGKYPVARDRDCTVVEIPYHGDASAILILPNPGKLHDVERNLQKVSRLELFSTPALLLVPKFSISPSLDLKEELSEMGMKTLFTDQADLSGINGGHNLRVSKAVHKAVVTVNEKGTEAAGSTGAGVDDRDLQDDIIAVKRPFLMTIVDKTTRTILFAGRIMRPEN
ncbi:serpin A3-5-like [Hyperolius riggenbachi]|uniref:serpin A3-5-like n=1 Tax=Hyperolius riggenbachi TaxID=752182 RepID=UPI0035A26998